MRCIGQAGRRRGRAREAGPPGRVCKPAGGVAPNGVTGARRCAAPPSPPLLAGGLTDATQTPQGYILTLSGLRALAGDAVGPLALLHLGPDLGRGAAHPNTPDRRVLEQVNHTPTAPLTSEKQ